MELTSLVPLEGGWSGETFLAEAAGERSVVRIFADPRHPAAAAEVNAALLRLVHGLLPVPRVLEVRRRSAELPPLLVTELLPGERAEVVLPRLGGAELGRVGAAFGRIAGLLAGMPQLRAGRFVDAELRVEPMAADLSAWVARHADRLGALGWSETDLDALRAVAERAQDLLEGVERVSVVHSDLNPKNLLLDPGSLEVTGVLDWEYAHAGHPFTDLGNLLRFDRDPAYVEGVLAGYATQRGGTARECLDLARSADLVALVELAGRRDANPVAARAHDHLLAIARSGDPHAVPFSHER